MRYSVLALSIAAIFVVAQSVHAGIIAEENKYKGDQGAWTITNDGTAAKDGVVDVYAAKWSIRTGEPLTVKVRSTTGYTAKVFRLGWYGGGGAKPVTEKSGSADPQPYPSTDTDEYRKYGLLHANWKDSLSFDTTGWLPGMYWVRIDQTGTGKQAATYVVVGEKAGEKWPILVLMPFNTEAAYNAWPGAARGGKSLYAFNSSEVWPSETIGIAQAVKVSFDRPFLVGAGTGDFTNYQYPALRWFERMPNYDVAYATDMDFDADPTVLEGRKAVIFVGHSEYWSRKMYDAALSARNKGVSFLSLSGDTLNWQSRYEDGYRTLVSFKESADNSCPRDIDGCALKKTDGTCAYKPGECRPEYFKSQTKDPEAVLGHEALLAGNIEEARKRFEVVTSHWNTLFTSDSAKLDVRRPGIYFTGVQTAGIITRPDGWGYPWCDYNIVGPKSWFLYEGVDCATIRGVGGYEIDSAATADRYYDPWRPTAGRDGVEVGQRRIGSLVQSWDGKTRGSASYYRMTSGAEVVALSGMGFSWALDDFAAQQNGAGDTSSACGQRMVQNALDRWTSGSVAPAPSFPDAGPGTDDSDVISDGGTDNPLPDGGTGAADDATVGGNNATTDGDASSCGCRTPWGDAAGNVAFVAVAAFVASVVVRNRRGRNAGPRKGDATG